MQTEILLNQVLTGKIRCVVLGCTYYVAAPTPEQRMEASFIYEDAFQESRLMGAFTSEDLMTMLIDMELWSTNEETELNSMPARLDAIKVEMYQKYILFQSKRVEQLRKTIEKMRQRQSELSTRKHQYDLYTCEGLAEIQKLSYLVENNTTDALGEKLDFSDGGGGLSRLLLETYISNRPNDYELRQLSKHPRWRMIWSSGRQEGRVFGVPSIYLTEEQQNLIAWSKLYDNVHEHPDFPSKDIVEDDDLLDGWLIVEQRNREKERNEKGSNKKGRGGAQEVFIPAETSDDAKRIEQMNEASASMAKRQRMAMLKKNKVVSEQRMPDSQQQISVQAAQQFRDRMKQTRKR